MMHITSAQVQHQRLEVCWSDGCSRQFPLIWLRDNCRCSACLHPHTWERTFDLLSVPDELAVTSALVTDEGGLEVRWDDDHHLSKFESGWLRRYAAADADDEGLRPTPRLWNSDLVKRIPRFTHAEVMQHDEALHAWLDALLCEGVAILQDTPNKNKEVLRVATRIAYPKPTNFGVHFEVRSERAPINNAYTSLPLPNHTDLVNWEQPPGFQFLHCFHNEASGGESTLVDGYCVAETIRTRDPEAFQVLSTTPVDFRYHDEGRDLRARVPMIGLDYDGKLRQIRFNFSIFAVQALPTEKQSSLYAAYRKFAAMLRSPNFAIHFRLEPGEILVIDNWRVLHGRSGFDPSTGKRHLQGTYVDRDELFSRWRVTNPKYLP